MLIVSHEDLFFDSDARQNGLESNLFADMIYWPYIIIAVNIVK